MAMISLHPTDLDIASPNALFAARSARLFARRRSPALREACSPRVILPAALLIACCYALLVLTGVGPQSWQARLCGDGGPRSSACQTLSAGHGSDPATRLDGAKDEF
jgi:hypothetical protein